MSEYTLLIHCTFENTPHRNMIRTFLDRDVSPISEDEVDESYRDAFLALEGVEWVDELANMGKTGLSIFYEVLPETDEMEEDAAKEILIALHKAGAKETFAYFADDE